MDLRIPTFTGTYLTGCGRAHEFMHTYDQKYFNCPLIGTFNVRLDQAFESFRPCIEHDAEVHRQFWLVRLGGRHYAWAVRWGGSRMPRNRIELVSKVPLPDYLKEDPFTVEVLEPLTPQELQTWISEQTYWFQSFSWSPQRADSALIWETVQPYAKWSGKTVLDIGCANGTHCFAASKAGAQVTGFEPDTPAREKGRFINDHIEMQDVPFVESDPGGVFDVIFYFSVHHQWDEPYEHLAEKITELRARARDALFVELIVPDLKRTRTAQWIDDQVDGQVLREYTHKVRKNRRIYHVKGAAE
jgi:predicted nicotinamide N-methyase